MLWFTRLGTMPALNRSINRKENCTLDYRKIRYVNLMRTTRIWRKTSKFTTQDGNKLPERDRIFELLMHKKKLEHSWKRLNVEEITKKRKAQQSKISTIQFDAQNPFESCHTLKKPHKFFRLFHHHWFSSEFIISQCNYN